MSSSASSSSSSSSSSMSSSSASMVRGDEGRVSSGSSKRRVARHVEDKVAKTSRSRSRSRSPSPVQRTTRKVAGRKARGKAMATRAATVRAERNKPSAIGLHLLAHELFAVLQTAIATLPDSVNAIIANMAISDVCKTSVAIKKGERLAASADCRLLFLAREASSQILVYRSEDLKRAPTKVAAAPAELLLDDDEEEEEKETVAVTLQLGAPVREPEIDLGEWRCVPGSMASHPRNPNLLFVVAHKGGTTQDLAAIRVNLATGDKVEVAIDAYIPQDMGVTKTKLNAQTYFIFPDSDSRPFVPPSRTAALVIPPVRATVALMVARKMFLFGASFDLTHHTDVATRWTDYQARCTWIHARWCGELIMLAMGNGMFDAIGCVYSTRRHTTSCIVRSDSENNGTKCLRAVASTRGIWCAGLGVGGRNNRELALVSRVFGHGPIVSTSLSTAKGDDGKWLVRPELDLRAIVSGLASARRIGSDWQSVYSEQTCTFSAYEDPNVVLGDIAGAVISPRFS